MCRSIKTLRPPYAEATDDDVRAAALQFVRKVSGYRTPSKANAQAFDTAVDEIAASSSRLLASLKDPRPLAARRRRIDGEKLHGSQLPLVPPKTRQPAFLQLPSHRGHGRHRQPDTMGHVAQRHHAALDNRTQHPAHAFGPLRQPRRIGDLPQQATTVQAATRSLGLPFTSPTIGRGLWGRRVGHAALHKSPMM